MQRGPDDERMRALQELEQPPEPEPELESFWEAHGLKICIGAFVVGSLLFYVFAFLTGDQVQATVLTTQYETMLTGASRDEVEQKMGGKPDEIADFHGHEVLVYNTDKYRDRVFDKDVDKQVSAIRVVMNGEGHVNNIMYDHVEKQSKSGNNDGKKASEKEEE